MNALRKIAIPYPDTKPCVPYDPTVDFVDDGTLMLLDKYITSRTKWVLEIGSCSGLTSRYISHLTQFKTGTLICIDTWDDTLHSSVRKSSVKMCSSQSSRSSRSTTRKSTSSSLLLSSSSSSSSTTSPHSQKSTSNCKTHSHPLITTFMSNVWDVRKRVIGLQQSTEIGVSTLLHHKCIPTVCYIHTQKNADKARKQLHCLIQAFPSAVVISNGNVHNPHVPLVVNEIMHQYTFSDVDVLSNGCAFLPVDYPCTKKKPSFVHHYIRRRAISDTNDTQEPLLVRTAIIVAYHPKLHRKSTVDTFVQELHVLLSQTNLIFKVFVMKQEEITVGANIGSLLNAGYTIAKSEGYDRFIFHDPHIIPRESMLPYYTYDAPLKGAMFLGKCALVPTPDWFTFGAVMFTAEVFEHLNGYPVNIYGYAGWDYAMLQRLRLQHVPLHIPPQVEQPYYIQKPKALKREEWERLYACQQAIDGGTNGNINGLHNVYYGLTRVLHRTRKHTKQNIATDYIVRVVSFKYFMSQDDDIVVELPHIEPAPGEDVFDFEVQSVDKIRMYDRNYGYLPEPLVYKAYKKSFLLRDVEALSKIFLYEKTQGAIDMIIKSQPKNKINRNWLNIDYENDLSIKSNPSTETIYPLWNILYYCNFNTEQNASVLLFVTQNKTIKSSMRHTYRLMLPKCKIQFVHTLDPNKFKIEKQDDWKYKKVLQIIHPLNLKYNVVHTHKLFTNTTSKHPLVFLSVCLIGLLKVNKNGTLIVYHGKLFDMMSNPICTVVGLLQSKFKSVKMIHTKYRPSSQLITLICKGFIGINKNESTQILAYLRESFIEKRMIYKHHLLPNLDYINFMHIANNRIAMNIQKLIYSTSHEYTNEQKKNIVQYQMQAKVNEQLRTQNQKTKVR